MIGSIVFFLIIFISGYAVYKCKNKADKLIWIAWGIGFDVVIRYAIF